MRSIPLISGGHAFVSDEDFITLSKCRWNLSASGFVRCTCRTHGWNTKYMQRIVAERMGLDIKGKGINHVDRNPLNNQRKNLRVATCTQSARNRKRYISNTSGCKGVFQQRNKWRAQIKINGTPKNLGLFDTPERAHQVYCEAAEKYFGEFANT